MRLHYWIFNMSPLLIYISTSPFHSYFSLSLSLSDEIIFIIFLICINFRSTDTCWQIFLWLNGNVVECASRYHPDHMTGEVNRSTCWWRDYEWRRELWGWRGGRSRGGGRGGDSGGWEGWRGWKISVSCPRVGEFFACRLGNTEGWWERGLKQSESKRGRAVNSSHWKWKRDSRGWPSESLSVGIDVESWKHRKSQRKHLTRDIVGVWRFGIDTKKARRFILTKRCRISARLCFKLATYYT